MSEYYALNNYATVILAHSNLPITASLWRHGFYGLNTGGPSQYEYKFSEGNSWLFQGNPKGLLISNQLFALTELPMSH